MDALRTLCSKIFNLRVFSTIFLLLFLGAIIATLALFFAA